MKIHHPLSFAVAAAVLAAGHSAFATPTRETALHTSQQSAATSRDTEPLVAPTRRIPFGVGEQIVYDAKFSFIHVGNGRMEIVGIDSIRGRPAYHIVFTISGGIIGFKVDDRYESWVDTATLSSLRYIQNIHEGGYKRNTTYDMYPERSAYRENGQSEDKPSVSKPLDDGSFIYFVRTVPMVVGQRNEFNDYFKADRNPVILLAERKESVEVPAGKFDALVIHPTIKTRGIFSEDGRAELWLSTDEHHVMVQMKSKLSFGSLNLYLKSYRPAPTSAAAAPTPTQ